MNSSIIIWRRIQSESTVFLAPSNKSLDAGGGGVFLKLACCGEGCFDSRAASTQTFGGPAGKDLAYKRVSCRLCFILGRSLS